MIRIKHHGNFRHTERFFDKLLHQDYLSRLEKYGIKGVDALASATPVDSGATARSWSYEIVQGDGVVTICWSNSNVNDGVNIAIILEYGHGTRNGGYVSGHEYINTALQPVFDQMANEVWKEVVSS